MITGQLVGIFNDPFFIYIHKKLLPADCADVIGKISCWYATDFVKLPRLSVQEEKKPKNNKIFA